MINNRYRLELCNLHLQELFRAVERGDVQAVERIEHVLTPQEECVACSYAFRAHGQVKQVLDSFLEKEGYHIEDSFKPSDVWIWIFKSGLWLGLLILSLWIGVLVKNWIFINNGQIFWLGSMGFMGAFFLATSVFILIDNWFF